MEFSYDSGVWSCRLAGRVCRMTAAEADAYVLANMREAELVGRVSPLLATQIECFRQEGEPPRQFAKAMMDVVAALVTPKDDDERPDPVSWEKPHKRFQKGTLGPLNIWHKHISLARHMPMNATLALAPAKPQHAEAQKDAIAASLIQAHAATAGDLDAVAAAAGETMMRAINRRAETHRQTGDWIVFDVVDGRPRFLCFFPHPPEDEDRDEELARLVRFVREHWT